MAGSTIEIAGHTFPTVGVVCPPDDDDRSEWSRALGVGRDSWWIPAENGVLFVVTPLGQEGLLNLNMQALSCRKVYPPTGEDDWIWLPWDVVLLDGRLIVSEDPKVGVWDWRRAERDWVAETIIRLSTKPFTTPDGPRCRMVDRFDPLDRETVDPS